jgi:hypothetical protein
VGVLGSYSNLCDQGEHIQHLLELVPETRRKPKPRTTKQVHRRLVQAQIEELVKAYQGGATLNELAERFLVHRDNVSRALQDQGVPRRYRLIEGERLRDAISAYNAGKSLAAIATEQEVSVDTVRMALIKASVPMRPRPGWRY